MMTLAQTKVTYGMASATLTHARGSIFALSNVYSYSRGKGHATGLLKRITEDADLRGRTLILIAQAYATPQEGALTNDQLVEFYRKFGFEIDPGSHLPYSMTRVPNRQPREEYMPHNERRT